MDERDDYVSARRYLAPLPSSLWRWDDKGEVVVWGDNTTIVFRQELQIILRDMVPQGLPPFSALVLLLAACRPSWQEISGQFGTTIGTLASIERRDFPDWLPKALQQLDRVHDLAADVRDTPETKATLARVVFQGCRGTSPEEAAKIVRGLSVYDPGILLPGNRPAGSLDDTMREIRTLYEGLERVDADALRMLGRTGLEQPVRPAEIPLAPVDRIRQLIAQLQDDEELGGVSRIARQLMAAVHFPRPIADRDDLPIGGVSDITNRGPLDRLLLSELAQDDLTLAVRVAVGEALYLRREAPPRNPPRHRAVLIDSGIRLWGVPRVFAAGVAMALAATADRRIEVAAFRARGRGVVPVDLTRREGLVAHLEALEVEAHPGGALEAFLGAVSAQGPAADVVVVTSDDAAEDEAFRRALTAAKGPAILLATVNREGRFRLVFQGPRSQRVVAESRLKLDELLTPRRRAAPLVDHELARSRPAILAMKPFPLLLSCQTPLDPRQAWAIPDRGVLHIVRNRMLLHFQRRGQGGRLLAQDLPSGTLHWVQTKTEDARTLAVVGHLQQGALWLLDIDIEKGECVSTALEIAETQPVAVCGHGGAIFVVYPDHADFIDPLTCRRMGTIPIRPGIKWQRDRFFAGSRHWYALSYDGLAAHLEPILAAQEPRGARHLYLTFIDVPGHDGPVGIDVRGQLFDTVRKEFTAIAHGFHKTATLRLLAISRKGDRILLAEDGDPRRCGLIEIPSGRVTRLNYGSPWHVEPDISKVAQSNNVRWRFKAIYADRDSRLNLISMKGSPVSIRLDAKSREIMLLPGEKDSLCEVTPIEFQPVASSHDVGYTLQVARWDDGSEAFLDSRGMLHLRSSDATIPELTLVLHERTMAGWCADGRLWGPVYFTGDRANCRGDDVYTEVLEPFLARLR